jgi:hypothetical protein
MLSKPSLEFQKSSGIGKFMGSPVTEMKTKSKGGARIDLLPDWKCVFIERFEGLRPCFPPVDIRATGKMQTRAEFHQTI